MAVPVIQELVFVHVQLSIQEQVVKHVRTHLAFPVSSFIRVLVKVLGCLLGGNFACQNGGTCQSSGTCVCLNGYSGSFCQTCKQLNLLL